MPMQYPELIKPPNLYNLLRQHSQDQQERELLDLRKQQFAQQAHENELAADTQRMDVISKMASAVYNKMTRTGLKPGSPEFQQALDATAAPFKPMMSKITGKPVDESPVDWGHIEALASLATPKQQPLHGVNLGNKYGFADPMTGQLVQQYDIAPTPTAELNAGIVARDGQFAPAPGWGQSKAYNTSLVEGAKEGEKIVKHETPEGAPYYSRAGDLTGDRYRRVAQALAPSLMQVESGGDPNAVSPAGAQGRFQIMPETAQNPGYGIQPWDKNKPGDDERFAVEYLAALLKESGGNIDKALSAYNAGNVNKPGITNPGYVEKVLTTGQTAAGKARAEAQAKAEVDLQKGQQEAKQEFGRSAKKVIDMLSTKVDGASVDDLINRATGSGIGAARDVAGRLVGLSSDSAQAAARLRVIGNWLTGTVPRFQGNQSDADRQYYVEMAGRLGDPSTPPAEKRAAKQALVALMSKYDENGNIKPENIAPPDDEREAIFTKYGVKR